MVLSSSLQHIPPHNAPTCITLHIALVTTPSSDSLLAVGPWTFSNIRLQQKMAAERKKSWPFDWPLLGNFGGKTSYALYGYWHCFLIAWYLGILAEERVATGAHQSPHSTLCLFTYINEHMMSID